SRSASVSSESGALSSRATAADSIALPPRRSSSSGEEDAPLSLGEALLILTPSLRAPASPKAPPELRQGARSGLDKASKKRNRDRFPDRNEPMADRRHARRRYRA